MAEDFEKHLPLAKSFVDFVNKSVTAFHAVDTAKSILVGAGFQQISEKEKWNVQPKGKYFFTRNQSTIVAFAVGGKYERGNGFSIIGAHTDSPHLMVKPRMSVEKDGFVQVAVEPYGGGLWPTWFDRDLTLAGRVIVKNDKGYESRLIRIDRPIMRIPTLAIHLNRDSSDKLEFNKQTHLLPILCSSIQGKLEEKDKDKNSSHAIVMKLLASELKCKVEEIKDFELSVVDTQPSVIGGINNEFIFSPRLDNLMMSFCSLSALIGSSSEETLQNDKNIRMVVLFDNEEIGSQTAHCAGSPIVNEVIKRITNSNELFEIAIRKSFLISADMAHAVHPNYSDKHDSNHKPFMHKGVVLKENANQRYATVATTALIIREIGQKHGVPIQDFVVRNDSLCGSTIGPIIAGGTGIRTVDVGNPQLSMHHKRNGSHQ